MNCGPLSLKKSAPVIFIKPFISILISVRYVVTHRCRERRDGKNTGGEVAVSLDGGDSRWC